MDPPAPPAPPAPAAAAAAPAPAAAPEKINLRVCTQGHEVYFTARKDRPFRRMFAKFAEMSKISESSLRFLFDGERINPDHTPGYLDMEDGDTIDAFIEMQGGGGVTAACDDFDAATNELLDAAWAAILELERRNGVDNHSAQLVVGRALRNVLTILDVQVPIAEPPPDQPYMRYERAQLLRIAAHQLRVTPPILLAYPLTPPPPPLRPPAAPLSGAPNV